MFDGEEMLSDDFIIVSRKNYRQCKDRRAVVRVDNATYMALAHIATISGRSMTDVAGKAVQYAINRLKIVDGEGG